MIFAQDESCTDSVRHGQRLTLYVLVRQGKLKIFFIRCHFAGISRSFANMSISPYIAYMLLTQSHSSLLFDTIGEFNVDSKAECCQLNLAHKTKTNKRQRPVLYKLCVV